MLKILRTRPINFWHFYPKCKFTTQTKPGQMHMVVSLAAQRGCMLTALIILTEHQPQYHACTSETQSDYFRSYAILNWQYDFGPLLYEVHMILKFKFFVSGNSIPFRVGVLSDNTGNAASDGFDLIYRQVPCQKRPCKLASA